MGQRYVQYNQVAAPLQDNCLPTSGFFVAYHRLAMTANGLLHQLIADFN